MFSTAYISHPISDTTEIQGTGFFYNAVRGPRSKERFYTFLITNHHVIVGATGGQVRLMRASLTGEPLLGESILIPFNESDWIRHPNADVDLVALPIQHHLNAFKEAGTPTYSPTIYPELFPSAQNLLDLDVLEPVVFIGYPNGRYDRKNLTPIIRKGTTATPIYWDFDGDPSFLIDASTFGGSSGSPVFIYNENGYKEGNEIRIGQSRLIFVGVATGTLHKSAKGILDDDPTRHVSFLENLDLGFVLNWRTVDEVVEAACLKLGFVRDLP
jgi:hypothetical protein